MNPGGALSGLVDRLRTSFWFVPTGILVGSGALASTMLWLDRVLPAERLPGLVLAFDGGPDAARSVLSTISSSMATVAGVVFSISIVVLTLAASQYSPRVIRNFMRDTLSQVVLGVFVGVFAYCVLVLGAVEGSDGSPGARVPNLSVTVAIASAMAAILLLVVYIHHIARAIQSVHILAAAAHETLQAVECLFPGRCGDEPPPGATPPALDGPPDCLVKSTRIGYAQRVDVERLLEIAARHDVVLRMECHIGDFLVPGSALASAHGTVRGDRGELEHRVRSAFAIGRFQTVEQDPGYGLREIVDVALRALSPAMNDETSAAEAIDYIGAVLARAAALPAPAHCHWLGGLPRVVARTTDFNWMLGLGFRQIVRVGAGSPETLKRVLQALERVRAAGPGRAAAIARMAARVEQAAAQGIRDPGDRAATLALARRLGAAPNAGDGGTGTSP